MKESALVFYMTAENKEEAEKIAKELISKKLAACVNILGDINSFYEWEGKVENGTETAFIAKTSKEKSSEFIEFVKSIHSYETPCIISFKPETGNPDFLSWIFESVKI
ncbi:MAG: divalent-cation tolerance protein CutA [Thermodesulfobacteriota bacterium]